MNAIRTALSEIYGLFVDDGSLAVGILVWVGVAAFGLKHFMPEAGWHGPLLFLGLAAILLENVRRTAIKRRQPSG